MLSFLCVVERLEFLQSLLPSPLRLLSEDLVELLSNHQRVAESQRPHDAAHTRGDADLGHELLRLFEQRGCLCVPHGHDLLEPDVRRFVHALLALQGLLRLLLVSFVFLLATARLLLAQQFLALGFLAKLRLVRGIHARDLVTLSSHLAAALLGTAETRGPEIRSGRCGAQHAETGQ